MIGVEYCETKYVAKWFHQELKMLFCALDVHLARIWEIVIEVYMCVCVVCDLSCQNAVNYSYSNFGMPQNVVNYNYI